jgi:hypothetical protein
MPEMEVYGSDGIRLGAVDVVEDGRFTLNLTSSSLGASLEHDVAVTADEVARVEGNRVHLRMRAAAALVSGGKREIDTGRTKHEPPASLKPS